MSNKPTYDELEEKLSSCEKQLQAANYKLSVVQKVVQLGWWEFDTKTEHVSWSTEMYDMYGVSQDESPLSFEHILELVEPDYQDDYRRHIDVLLATGSVFFEYRIQRGDGKECWLETRASRRSEQGSHTTHIVGVTRDITGSKKNEKSLKQSEDKVRTSLNILKEAQKFAKIGSWWFDPVTQMPIWTDEMFHIFGLEPQPEALPYDEHRKIIHPDDWNSFDEAVNRAVTAGIGYNLELRITRPGGEIAYVNARCEAEKNQAGEVIRLIGTTQDITERKLAELELRKSEDKYKYLFENMVQGAFYQSSDGTLLDVNSAALDIFGLTYDQFIGKTSQDRGWRVVREDGSDFPGEEHPSMVALSTGKPCRDVVAGIYDTDRSLYKWVTINAVPQFEENQDKASQVIVTMHEITDRKQSEDLQRLQHELTYSLSDVQTLEHGLGMCLDTTLRASNMEAGGLYLVNEENGGIDLVHHKGLDEEFVREVHHYDRNSENVKLLHKGAPKYAEFESSDVPPVKARAAAGFKAICIIPILFQDQLIGSINLTSSHHKTVPEFSRVALETISRQIGAWVNLHRTKQILLESEERFSLAMDAAQDGTYDWDLKRNTVYFSPGWKRMLGYENSELANDLSVWEELTDPVGVKRAWEMMQELISKKRDRFELEFRMKHKEGHWIDILSRATARFDDAGVAARIIGTHVDITERKNAEKKLSDVLQFNEKIVSETPVGISIYEAESGRCIAANDAVANLIGGTKQEVLKQNYLQIESWKKSGLLALAEGVLREKNSKRKTVELTSTFGKYLAIDFYLTQFSFGDKQHLFLTTIDVSKRLKAEKTIIEQREKAELILNLAGVMFIGLDREGNINVANEKACQVLEVDQKDVIGQNWIENYVPLESKWKVRSIFQQIMDGDIKSVEYYENAVISKSGRKKFIAWHNSVIKDRGGKVIGMLGSGEDITEQKQLRLKLQQAQKMESIGTLAGGIAHDFNNILSSIIGFSQLALDGVEKGSEVEDDILEVLSAGSRAKDLVNQILTFARQSDEAVKPIQIKPIAKETLKFLKSSIPTSIQIVEKVDSESFVMGAPTQIHQILMNLCTNASQAMEDGAGVLELSVEDVTVKKSSQGSDLASGEYIKISIKDTGTGIPPQNIATIFEPYFTTKKVGEGTGMGLAVVHGIVESYGGAITVDSSAEKGSTFSVYLPITKKRKKHKRIDKAILPSGREHILFVDDEAAIAKMGSRTLGQLGYVVTTRTSSIEALELFRTKPNEFDLVVTDMTMPNMTGDTLAVEVMKIRPEIPVIICTGYSNKISDENAKELGISALVYKPVVKKDFAEIVRKILDET